MKCLLHVPETSSVGRVGEGSPSKELNGLSQRGSGGHDSEELSCVQKVQHCEASTYVKRTARNNGISAGLLQSIIMYALKLIFITLAFSLSWVYVLVYFS